MRAMLLGTGAGGADPKRFSPANLVWLGEEPVLVDGDVVVGADLMEIGSG